MNKKYRLIKFRKEGETLHRIQALKDFGDVKKGDLGGWIESENNLSQKGDCWIYGNAKIEENVIIKGNAKIYDNVQIYGNAVIQDNVKIYNNAFIFGNVKIFGNARIYENAIIQDNAFIGDNVEIYGNALIATYAAIRDNAKIFDNATVTDNATVKNNAKVFGKSRINQTAQITGDAEIKSTRDYALMHHNWFDGRVSTYTKSNNMWISDDKILTGEQLIKDAYLESRENGENCEKYVNFIENF